MAGINVDINETEIFNLYPEVLNTLLKQDEISFGQRIPMLIKARDFSMTMP